MMTRRRENSLRLLVVLGFLAALLANSAGAADREYLPLVRAHLDRHLAVGLDRYGRQHTAMWLAAIDPVQGGLPERRDPLGRRWYRDIHSPNGSNLYWDQPLLVAAYALSGIDDQPRYAQAADDYVREFLQRCVAEPTGLFQWGNHIYYDVQRDEPVGFSGGYHELRPHPVAWEVLWRIAPDATRRTIQAIHEQHVKDKQTGRFCRHANPQADAPPNPNADTMPFLEAGAVLIESLAFLGEQDPALATEMQLAARQVAEYSYAQRDPTTGLVRNQPVVQRWDYHASSNEIGLWAGSLLRAAQRLQDPRLAELADQALSDWLRWGWDEAAGRYYGQLEVRSGQPLDPGQKPEHQPRLHSRIWKTDLAPTHDYPLPTAEACLTLYQQTGKDIYRTAARRWVQHVRASLPAGDGHGGYADEYGRVIHFLVRASAVLDDPKIAELAHAVARDAVDKLYIAESGMFRTHPGEDRTDAIDGPGVLLLALLYLEQGSELDLLGFGY